MWQSLINSKKSTSNYPSCNILNESCTVFNLQQIFFLKNILVFFAASPLYSREPLISRISHTTQITLVHNLRREPESHRWLAPNEHRWYKTEGSRQKWVPHTKPTRWTSAQWYALRFAVTMYRKPTARTGAGAHIYRKPHRSCALALVLAKTGNFTFVNIIFRFISLSNINS